MFLDTTILFLLKAEMTEIDRWGSHSERRVFLLLFLFVCLFFFLHFLFFFFFGGGGSWGKGGGGGAFPGRSPFFLEEGVYRS